MLVDAAIREGDAELAPGGRGSRRRGKTMAAPGAEAPAAALGRGGEEDARRAAVRVEQGIRKEIR